MVRGLASSGQVYFAACVERSRPAIFRRNRAGRIGSISSGAKMHSLRKQTGMVFQQHQLIGRLSALANVLTGRLGFHGAACAFLPLPRADKVIALEALERVGMLECVLARVDQLSGGQQQRIGLARALAQRPQLLLADEPVASLDPATAVKVLGLLREICKADKIATIVSLHQVHLAQRFADRIVGISGGRVVFDGATDDLDDATLTRIYGPESRETRVRSDLSQRHLQRRA